MQNASPNSSEFQLCALEVFEDERGLLLVLDALEEKYFPVKRVFFISDFPTGETRGKHGHHECEQILICLKGNLRLVVSLNGETRSLTLRENEYVYLPKATWASLESLHSSTFLAVLCSDKYDHEDFFYDPNHYVKGEVKNV